MANICRKFKRPKHANPPQNQNVDLSPFAKQVLEHTQIDYRFYSSTSPKRQPVKTTSSANGTTSSQGSCIEISARPPQVVIKIPQPSDQFKRDAYVSAPESPKRRKLNNEGRDSEAALRLRTQREQGDTAVLQFQDLLLEIFEAQDRLELDLSNGVTPDNSALFEPPDEEEDSKIRLTVSVLGRLQTRLKLLVDLNRLSDILPEHMKRLQQVCEPSIEIAQTLNLRLNQSPSEDDLSTWQQRIHRSENGAMSACVFVYTTLGNRSDEFALSAETLHSIPNLLVNVYENCLIPVIESRHDGQEATLYSHAVDAQDDLKKLLDDCRKLLDLMASCCVQVSEAADCVNTTEFLAAKLIFVQNASTEKASALGLQNYERVRKQAMFSLARLYAAYPEQRSPILDEILSSLDKLPSTSRSARQYKLRDGKSVMLISALFMQLVQTAALENSHHRPKSRKSKTRLNGSGDASDEDGDQDEMDVDDDENHEQDELSRLRDKADQLFVPASKSGQEIVLYMVGKASKVSKTGDSPYRNVLDLFIEDLVNLLPLPEWPAAELLLRILAAKMTELATTEKAAAIKNMALESLGTMGSAISATRAAAKSLASSLARDAADDHGSAPYKLARLNEEHFATGLRPEELFSPSGPFAITSLHFDSKTRESLRAKSSRSFFLAQYAKLFCMTQQDEAGRDQATQDLAFNLLEQLSEAAWEPTSSSTMDDPRLASLAYLLSLLNLGLCRRYEPIVRTLLSSLSSDQAQVRSRSLKSVVTILETDPSLLDRDLAIADDVFRCASDDSAMVRDASLSLIAKFIISRPALEEKGIKKLLECAGDSKIGVQKRAIGHLADIYTQENRPRLKAAIAQTFLRRTVDLEESVRELAKRTLTDAWISPSLVFVSERTDPTKSKISIEALTSHIADTLQHEPNEMSALLTKYLVWLLKIGKTAERVGELLNRIGEVLFQSTIDGSATESSLLTLVCIAEARPQSIAPQQLSHLKRYLGHIASEEDLPMFRAVIGIFRHVLPRLSISHQTLLQDIQGDLLRSTTKLARRMELDEVMSCLRTIDGLLGNGIRFVKLLASIVVQIGNPAVNHGLRTRLVRIAGSLGKHIDLDQLPPINGAIPSYKGGSVAGFLTDVIYPYAAKSDTETLQLVALESLGALCQAWPSQFDKVKVRDLFTSVLAGGDSQESVVGGSKAQVIVLKVLEELYSSLAIIKDEPDAEDEKLGEVQDLKKMGGTKKAQDDNSALATMANHVHKQIVRIALSAEDEKALLAVQLLSSVAARGMFHPKDYAHVFLALETSSDPNIREAAEKAHQLSHQQHESHWEREYVNAVRQAFVYQKKHFEDPSGTWQGEAKLASCFKVVNSSGSKYVKKFISTLISRLSTDFTKLDVSKSVPDHVLFVRFVAQNIAFFDYTKQDDLLHTILQLELLFSKNGAEISQAMEANLSAALEPVARQDDVEHASEATLVNGEVHGTINDEAPPPVPAPGPLVHVDPILLQRLTAASIAVTMLSEAKTHLKRQYGVSRDVRAAMQQNKQAKESTKAPVKVYGITGERFWANTTTLLSSLTSSEAMLMRCREFHGLMTIDEEVKVGEEEDDYGERYSASVDPEAPQGPKRGRKRKADTGSAGGTPKKQRGRARKSMNNGNRRSSSTSSRDDPDADYGA